MENLNDDILIKTLGYLSESELLSCGVTCKRLQECLVEDLWRDLHEVLFHPSRQLVNIPSEHFLAERIKKLSISQLKQSLVGVNTVRCVEKKEYQKLLAIRLFFRNIHFSSGNISFPTWSFEIPLMKLSFFFSKRDLRRARILQSELCIIDWQFRFKGAAAEAGWGSKFFEDGSMISEMHGERMNWVVSDTVIQRYSDTCGMLAVVFLD